MVASETDSMTVHPAHLSAPAMHELDSRRYVWYVVFLLAVVNVFNYMDRLAFAVLAPSIKRDLGLSDAQVGLLSGLAFALFYGICGVPIARWADRGVRRNIIALALASWSLMTALSGAAQNFTQLFIARIGVGAGEAGGLPPAQSILCDYVPLKRRAYVFSLTSFGLIVGMMCGMALAGWLGETIGWRWAFVVLGLPGIGLALVVRFTLREPDRGCLDAKKSPATDLSFADTVSVLWVCRTYRLLLMFLTLMALAQYGLNQWWPSLYTRLYGLGMSSAGVYLGVAIGVGSGIGLLIGGMIAARTNYADVRTPLRLCAVVTAFAFPASLISLFVTSALWSVLLVSAAAVFWSVSNGVVAATAASVVSSRMRATAAALTMFAQSAIGLTLGPLSVGLLSDALSPILGTEALRYALLLPVGFLPITVFMLLGAAKELPSDLGTQSESQVDSASNAFEDNAMKVSRP